MPLILGTLDITIDDNTSAITNIFYAILVLTIIAMLCFINVLGYFFVYLLVNKYKYEEKYPKFKKIINYFNKGTIISIILEALICFLCLLFIILISLKIVYSGI